MSHPQVFVTLQTDFRHLPTASPQQVCASWTRHQSQSSTFPPSLQKTAATSCCCPGKPLVLSDVFMDLYEKQRCKLSFQVTLKSNSSNSISFSGLLPSAFVCARLHGWANRLTLGASRYQTLVNDPAFTSIGNRSRSQNDPKTRRRLFFTKALWTDSTIRASQTFYKGFIPVERWSGKPRPAEAQTGAGESRMICSLGDSLSGSGAGYVSITASGRANAHKGNLTGPSHMEVSWPRCWTRV